MQLLTLWILIFIQGISSQEFSYQGPMGPEHWAEEYSSCSGKYQSPININSSNVELEQYANFYMNNFDKIPTEGLLLNNGHTAVLRLSYEGKPPHILGGPLNGDTFLFSQLHFHWGQNSLEGSEDRINNKAYPAELHIVFYNELYKDFEEALQHSKGITVLAFFFAIQSKPNPYYELLSNKLEEIQKPHTSVKVPAPDPLEIMIPKNVSQYFTYVGSLTTPPCSEHVTWMDFLNPIMISETQIERFRRLNGSDGAPLKGNFRPVQPLNDRTIYFNYLDYSNSIPFIRSGSESVSRAINFSNIVLSIAIMRALAKILGY